MDEGRIYEELTKLVREVLDHKDLILAPETTADEIEGWDSMTHINIIVAVQSHFGIRLTTKEIDSISNVGDLARFIGAHLATGRLSRPAAWS